ncbi:hypothetical protein FRB90_000567 [Tulasnella sp. 427]|nr:hypothetical protein FRB90_000567 [Tulasnella sp. 427]
MVPSGPKALSLAHASARTTINLFQVPKPPRTEDATEPPRFFPYSFAQLIRTATTRMSSTSQKPLPSSAPSIVDVAMSPPADQSAQSRKRTSHSRKLPVDHIPRPPNAFILFRTNFVAEAKLTKGTEADHRNISKIAGAVWRSLLPDEKLKWHNKALEEKEAHRKKYPNYRYTPVARRENVSRRMVKQKLWEGVDSDDEIDTAPEGSPYSTPATSFTSTNAPTPSSSRAPGVFEIGESSYTSSTSLPCSTPSTSLSPTSSQTVVDPAETPAPPFDHSTPPSANLSRPSPSAKRPRERCDVIAELYAKGWRGDELEAEVRRRENEGRKRRCVAGGEAVPVSVVTSSKASVKAEEKKVDNMLRNLVEASLKLPTKRVKKSKPKPKTKTLDNSVQSQDPATPASAFSHSPQALHYYLDCDYDYPADLDLDPEVSNDVPMQLFASTSRLVQRPQSLEPASALYEDAGGQFRQGWTVQAKSTAANWTNEGFNSSFIGDEAISSFHLPRTFPPTSDPSLTMDFPFVSPLPRLPLPLPFSFTPPSYPLPLSAPSSLDPSLLLSDLAEASTVLRPSQHAPTSQTLDLKLLARDALTHYREQQGQLRTHVATAQTLRDRPNSVHATVPSTRPVDTDSWVPISHKMRQRKSGRGRRTSISQPSSPSELKDVYAQIGVGALYPPIYHPQGLLDISANLVSQGHPWLPDPHPAGPPAPPSPSARSAPDVSTNISNHQVDFPGIETIDLPLLQQLVDSTGDRLRDRSKWDQACQRWEARGRRLNWEDGGSLTRRQPQSSHTDGPERIQTVDTSSEVGQMGLDDRVDVGSYSALGASQAVSPLSASIPLCASQPEDLHIAPLGSRLHQTTRTSLTPIDIGVQYAYPDDSSSWRYQGDIVRRDLELALMDLEDDAESLAIDQWLS